MNKLLIFWVLIPLTLSLFSCKSNQDQNFTNIIEVKSKIHSSFLDQEGNEFLKIEISLHNISEDTIKLLIWTCGWPGDQIAIRPNVFDIPFDCLRNFIKSISIEPSKSLDLILSLQAKEKLIQLKNKKFKIGFFWFPNWASLYSFSDEYEKTNSIDLVRRYNGHIYWSNQIKIIKKWLKPRYKADIVFEILNSNK